MKRNANKLHRDAAPGAFALALVVVLDMFVNMTPPQAAAIGTVLTLGGLFAWRTLRDLMEGQPRS